MFVPCSFCTCALLMALSHLYRDMFAFWVLLLALELISHWCQMYRYESLSPLFITRSVLIVAWPHPLPSLPVSCSLASGLLISRSSRLERVKFAVQLPMNTAAPCYFSRPRTRRRRIIRCCVSITRFPMRCSHFALETRAFLCPPMALHSCT